MVADTLSLSTHDPKEVRTKTSGHRSEDSEAMIAVMGLTGTGKSSFIKTLTDDLKIKISERLDPETKDVALSHYDHRYKKYRRVTLVDTPGFDHSDLLGATSDVTVLEKITTFLKNEGKNLNGVIYLHRISDQRMTGALVRNVRIFKKICGARSLRNVAIVTTFWDKVEKVDGLEREKELEEKPTVFQNLISEGARYYRHDNARESACRIVEQLLDIDPSELHIQTELAEGKKLGETEAGIELRTRIESRIADVRKENPQAAQLKWLEEERDRLNGRRDTLEQRLMVEIATEAPVPYRRPQGCLDRWIENRINLKSWKKTYLDPRRQCKNG